jgi:hypothetical protein
VILPLVAYGIRVGKEFWLHDEGDCDALTFEIWPLLNVTVAERLP